MSVSAAGASRPRSIFGSCRWLIPREAAGSSRKILPRRCRMRLPAPVNSNLFVGLPGMPRSVDKGIGTKALGLGIGWGPALSTHPGIRATPWAYRT